MRRARTMRMEAQGDGVRVISTRRIACGRQRARRHSRGASKTLGCERMQSGGRGRRPEMHKAERWKRHDAHRWRARSGQRDAMHRWRADGPRCCQTRPAARRRLSGQQRLPSAPGTHPRQCARVCGNGTPPLPRKCTHVRTLPRPTLHQQATSTPHTHTQTTDCAPHTISAARTTCAAHGARAG